MSRSRAARLLALPLIVAMLAVACGDGGGDTGEAPGTTEEATGEPAPTGTAAFGLDEPVRFVLMVLNPETSTDPNVVPDYSDGARMAIEQINEAGGVGGQDLEMEIVETPPAGEEVVNSFNLAQEAQPTVILGPVSSTALQTIGADRLNDAGIPVMHFTTTAEARASGSVGSDWSFGMRPTNELMAVGTADHAVNELGAGQIGLLHISAAYGEGAAAAQTQYIEGTDAQVAAERSFEFNATDLTQEVQAMADTDAVLDWGTPNTQALAVRTFAQQGITGPTHIIPNGPAFGSFVDAVGDPSLLQDQLAVLDCNPMDADHAGDFRSAWNERYDYRPSYAGAEFYDAVRIVAEVIREQQSADPEAVREGLADLEYDQGACAPTYENIDNVLLHRAVVAEVSPEELTTTATLDLTTYDLPAGG